MREPTRFFEKMIAAQQALLRDDEHSLRDAIAAFGDGATADWVFLYKAEPIAPNTQPLIPIAAWHNFNPLPLATAPDVQSESIARLRKGEFLRDAEVNAVAFSVEGVDAINRAATCVMPVRYKEEFFGALWISWCAMRETNEPERVKPFLESLGLYNKRKRVERMIWEHQTELITLRETALSASKSKSEFLASMSHEIRTPMNAILGATDLLMETPLSAEQRHYVSLSKNAGSALLTLIDDILDFSKVEAGQMKLEKVDFDLRDLVERIIEMMSIRANEKKLTLQYSVAPDVPLMIVGDPNRLRQVLVNLIGNAIKFTSEGSVTVSVQKDAESTNHLRFAVADTGIGIPKEKQAEIFEQFAQADSSNTRRFGGVGLGLAISRRLVELMRGKIWVESDAGKGSRFSFTAQVEPSTLPEPAESMQTFSLKGQTVLVIDDDELHRKNMVEMFFEWDAATVETVSNADSAEKIQQALDEQKSVNVVVLNCRMPDRKCEKLAAAIHARQLQHKTIVMVFNARRQSDFKRLERLNVAAYLVKPVRRNDIAKVLQQVTTEKPATVAAEEDSIKTPRLNILLAEDSVDNQLLVRAYLKKTPHTLDVAESGTVAVEKFKRGTYDLILMDVQMPDMDGYTATETIRRYEKETGKARIPIIALTAHALKEDEEKAFVAGCNAYLTKPVKKEALINAVQQFSNSTHSKENV